MHLAVQSGQHEVVEILLGHGASVYCKAGKTKESPLHICSRTENGHLSAEVLIKSGAPINDVDEVRQTMVLNAHSQNFFVHW